MHTYMSMNNLQGMKSTCVLVRCVYYNLHEHACISGTSMPKVGHLHLGVQKNCKPRITV